MGNFIVKCDECKKLIKKNASFVESVQGGICKECREGITIKQLIKVKDKDFPDFTII